MTTDLMFPLLFILIAYLYIEETDAPIILMLVGLLFIPISFLFALSVGNYTHLFTSDITAFFAYNQFRWMLQGVMFTVPAAAFFRLVYVRRGLEEAL